MSKILTKKIVFLIILLNGLNNFNYSMEEGSIVQQLSNELSNNLNVTVDRDIVLSDLTLAELDTIFFPFEKFIINKFLQLNQFDSLDDFYQLNQEKQSRIINNFCNKLKLDKDGFLKYEEFKNNGSDTKEKELLYEFVTEIISGKFDRNKKLLFIIMNHKSFSEKKNMSYV